MKNVNKDFNSKEWIFKVSSDHSKLNEIEFVDISANKDAMRCDEHERE